MQFADRHYTLEQGRIAYTGSRAAERVKSQPAANQCGARA